MRIKELNPHYARYMLGILTYGLVMHYAAAETLDVLEYAEPQNAYKVYQYTSTASGVQTWKLDGRLLESPSEPETINNKDYRTRIQKSENLPEYFPKESKVYYREQNDGLFTAFYEDAERFSEYLQIPSPLSVGMTWQGPSGYWDSETLESIGAFESPAGRFERCLMIRRNKTIEDPPQKLMSISVHCPRVGGVRSLTEHQMDGFQSSTETLLVEIDSSS
ncbi:MAG: hypothetical protein WBM41_13640 [Arenicellales bacterium]